MPPNLDELFERLAKSKFRAKFHLRDRDLQYLHNKGIDAVMHHAVDMIGERLAPAEIPNDGRQTPWRGHPVFVAQHATACCCRGCLQKWHGIERGKKLDDDEVKYVLSVVECWLKRESYAKPQAVKSSEQGELFDTSDR